MTNFKKYIYHKQKELSIICHRGLWVKEKYPENSISAIRNAVDSNFPIVEIDVRKNMNNDFFLMHDEDLIRTTNISGKISSISSNEIKNAFLKKGNGEKNILSNEKIPSLEEVLNTFRKDILFDIDVKNEDPASVELEVKIDKFYISFWDGYSLAERFDFSSYERALTQFKKSAKRLAKNLRRF